MKICNKNLEVANGIVKKELKFYKEVKSYVHKAEAFVIQSSNNHSINNRQLNGMNRLLEVNDKSQSLSVSIEDINLPFKVLHKKFFRL